MNNDIFLQRESNVRSYCRVFPDVFTTAKGAELFSESGKRYIDFFAGAGALNYGHNNDKIKRDILEYIENDGVMHGLDMHTTAKRDFLETFCQLILTPRNLDYKIMFCGPTGTNAVECAMKLARRVKRRSNIFSFMGGYHGHSLGSLAATGNNHHRNAAGTPLANVTFVPYPSFSTMSDADTLNYIEAILSDTHSGIEKPAAMILETVQAEGGIVVAPVDWIRQLRELCDHHDILLICDDIQVGCGRTGPFFSFERAGIVPDMVTLSKSISGYGLPMSLLLMRPEYDQWRPAEHTGTFRGNQLAFVGAAAALKFFQQNNLSRRVEQHADFLRRFLLEEIAALHPNIKIRGLGMIWGVDLAAVGGPTLTSNVLARCFEYGVIIESVGRSDTVLKILPPLVIEPELLEHGCQILKQALVECLKTTRKESMLHSEASNSCTCCYCQI